MMKIAVIAITRNGSRLGEKLREMLGGDLYIQERFWQEINRERPLEKSRIYPLEGHFIEFIHTIFNRYDGLIFLSAVGIAVRSIAGVLRKKTTDPAVVVLDEQGKFAVSLLSGHLGGANELAARVAELLRAVPVVTTASDGIGCEGIEVTAKKMGLFMEKFADLKKVTSSIVNGEKVGFLMDSAFPARKIEEIREKYKSTSAFFCNEINFDDPDSFSNRISPDTAALVYITDSNIDLPDIPCIILRPRSIVLGVGTKKGAGVEDFFALVNQVLKNLDLSESSIGSVATIDRKQQEECIEKFTRFYELPLIIYSTVQLIEVEDRFPVSSFVKSEVGVGSVARPSAYLASSCGEELGYYKERGITLAVYRRTLWAG
ncbi:MAG: cobalt-precorrin 5A hydrolase [Candidatus Atribacteria bacterium]|nr:cobalt-precorrin 5A hydrolase [Candidatus Atribacteria bacterium]